MEQTTPDVPRYDLNTRELYYRGALVLEFLQPAEYQSKILEQMQFLGWPPYVPSPITASNGDTRRRLADAVCRLNRRCRPFAFEFSLRRHIIRWRPVETRARTRRRSASCAACCVSPILPGSSYGEH